jgi:hypothetical protein
MVQMLARKKQVGDVLMLTLLMKKRMCVKTEVFLLITSR